MSPTSTGMTHMIWRPSRVVPWGMCVSVFMVNHFVRMVYWKILACADAPVIL